MPTKIPKIIITSIISISFVSGSSSLVCAKEDSQLAKAKKQQEKQEQEKEKNFTATQSQARIYRQQGLDFQRRGNLKSALTCYQKAAELDSAYAVVFNDLGVIYEAMKMTDRAEENYLKAVNLDPNLLSTYTNLALLYENKRDLLSAATYWQKRAELGLSDDPWTAKARQRFQDVQMVLGQRKIADLQEDQVINLMKDVKEKKEVLKSDELALSKDYFEKAKIYYKKGYEVEAVKAAVDAQSLDPANDEIKNFIERVQKRLLSQ